MKRPIKILIAVLVVLAVLAVAFWVGGDSPGSKGWQVDDKPQANAPADTVPTPDAQPSVEPSAPVSTPEEIPVVVPDVTELPPAVSVTPEAAVTPAPSATPEATPQPTPEPTPEPEVGKMEVTISISCADVFEHSDSVSQSVLDILPADGWILKPVTVTLNEGENVFNILQRTCKQNRIPMEHVMTPIYNTAYIEGINNLYEFACGETSGWKYTVNATFPSVGCSGYTLSDGDVIEWHFACDLEAFEENYQSAEHP